MKKRFAFPALCFFLILGGALYSLNSEVAKAVPLLAVEKTLVLYDATWGAVPAASLMNFTDFPPGAASPTYSNGATVLDTTLSGSGVYAGWTSNDAITLGFPILDRTAGFQVDFTLQIENESHSNNNRAGFSMIILSEDAGGIELAFWENEIWAQNDSSTGGLFTHGEGVTFPTTTGPADYRLTVTGDTYTLTANAQPILTGSVRDYSDFDGVPDPYQTPNFLFLGDDTTSAQARVRLGFVSVTGTNPGMPTATFQSISSKDGHLFELSENSNVGWRFNTNSARFYVGDDRQNRQYLSILSFDTSSLPDDAVILSATLNVKRARIIGANPFNTHGALGVEIGSPCFGSSCNLEVSNFQAGAQDIAGLLSSFSVDGWHSAPLGVNVLPYIDLTGITQFRLRFELEDNNDRGMDAIQFLSGDAPEADRPQLVIEYFSP